MKARALIYEDASVISSDRLCSRFVSGDIKLKKTFGINIYERLFKTEN